MTRTRTLWRSSGGKSPRSARAREIVQAFQALALKAVTPLRDGVGVATQFGSHVVVAGDVWAVAAEDQAGAKGMSRGAIKVADYHANLIFNEGGGSAAELRELIAELKERVRAQFGIELEEEVQYVA